MFVLDNLKTKYNYKQVTDVKNSFSRIKNNNLYEKENYLSLDKKDYIQNYKDYLERNIKLINKDFLYKNMFFIDDYPSNSVSKGVEHLWELQLKERLNNHLEVL